MNKTNKMNIPKLKAYDKNNKVELESFLDDSGHICMGFQNPEDPSEWCVANLNEVEVEWMEKEETNRTEQILSEMPDIIKKHGEDYYLVIDNDDLITVNE